jgi:hypothetical protein
MIANSYGRVVGGLFLEFPLSSDGYPSQEARQGKEAASEHRWCPQSSPRSRTGGPRNYDGSLGLVAFGLFLWRFLDDEPAWLILLAASVASLVTSTFTWNLGRIVRGHLCART